MLVFILHFYVAFTLKLGWYHTLTRDTSISNDVAKGIAKGDIDPFTKMAFEVYG